MQRGYIGTKPPSLQEWFVPQHKRLWWRRMGFKIRRNATATEIEAANLAFGQASTPRPLGAVLKDAAVKRAEAAEKAPQEPAGAPVAPRPAPEPEAPQDAPSAPEGPRYDLAEVQRRRAGGESLRAISGDLGVSVSTLSRALKKAEA